MVSHTQKAKEPVAAQSSPGDTGSDISKVTSSRDTRQASLAAKEKARQARGKGRRAKGELISFRHDIFHLGCIQGGPPTSVKA